MENQKEMVEFVKWIATNVKGFEKSTPEEIVAAINGMTQSEEGKKSLQELFAKFQSSKKKFQFGGVIPRMQYGGDTLRYTTLRPIVSTGYLEPIGEDRTISRRYPTYSPGTAPARSEFYTADGYARRIIGNDTTWLKRRPIAYTPAGNPENNEDANYVHIWEEVMPTSWLRAMFNREPDSVESPEFVESQQNGGTVSRYGHKFYADAERDDKSNTDYRTGRLRNGRYYEAAAGRSPEGATTEYYYLGEHEQNGELKPSYYLQRDIYPRNDGPADTVWVYRIPRPHAYHFTSANLINEPFEKVVTSDGYNNMKIWGGNQDVNMGAENSKKVSNQIDSIFTKLRLNLEKKPQSNKKW